MNNYFNINLKFILSLILALGLYLAYLYLFRQQEPAPFYTRQDCTSKQRQAGSVEANAFFDRYFEEHQAAKDTSVALAAPSLRATLNDSIQQLRHQQQEQYLAFLNDSILQELCLNANTQISAQLLQKKLEATVEGYTYRYYDYPINQVNGLHTQIPTLLTAGTTIQSLQQAQRYIQHIQQVPFLIEQLIQQLEIRAQQKNILPQYLFAPVIQQTQDLLQGKPIDQSNTAHILWQDFNQKIAEANIAPHQKDTLTNQLQQALVNHWKPAYQKLYEYLLRLQEQAGNEAGVWRLEQGAAYYSYLLEKQLSISLTPDEIFKIGKEEVARIRQEMQQRLQTYRFKGNLDAFLEHLRTDQQFYYTNTPKGQKAYLATAQAYLDSISPKLEAYFPIQAPLDLQINIAPQLSEQASQQPFYPYIWQKEDAQTYHISMQEMSQLPNYQIAAQVYRQLLPGYHLHHVITTQADSLPPFRSNASLPYIKGWGLYAAQFSEEIGLYQADYAAFGRLVLEMQATCQLVVDVGLHHQKWSRKRAIDYYKKNTPLSLAACIQEVDKHIVFPAQAVAYKIGMITLLELRTKAQEALGEAFDIKDFHKVVLSQAALPLDVLQDVVDEYIQQTSEKTN